jgi:hypothetical protein
VGIKRHLEVASYILRLKNFPRLSIKIIWSLYNGLKDITILIAEIEEITIWQKRDGGDIILILASLKKW